MIKQLISIIIPIYNNEKHLKRCINSVLHQDYSNLQIILVDDGSTDNTGSICNEYANFDSRILVIHQLNKGLSGARNTGLDNATGDYIYFLDSDDWISSTAISTLLNLAVNTEADITIAKHVDVTDYKEIYSDITYNQVYSSKECLEEINKCNVTFITAWNKLFKKNIFNHLRFSEGYINEDEAIIHHIYGENRKIAVSNEHLYFYYHHSNSIMSSSNPAKFFNGYYNAFSNRYQYYDSVPLYKIYKKDALKRLYGCCYDYLKSTPSLTLEDIRKINYCIKLLFKNFDLRAIKLSFSLKSIKSTNNR